MFKFQKTRNGIRDMTNVFLTEFDIFKTQPELRIQKQQKYSTRFGQIFTVLMYTLYIYYIVVQIVDLQSYTNPRVVMSQIQPQNQNPFLIQSSNFTFVLVITDTSLNGLTTAGKYFNLYAQNCIRTRKLNDKGNLVVNLNCTNIPLEQCESTAHFSTDYQKEYFSKFKLNTMFCINTQYWENNEIGFQGHSQADTFQFINVIFNKCQNSTSSSECASNEEINSKMNNGFYVLYLSDSLVQMDTKGRPYQDIITIQYNSFNINSSQSVLSNLRVSQSTTDYGLLFENKINDEALLQSNIQSSTTNYNGQYLVQNSIFLEQRQDYYQRSYQKLTALLGQMGGLWEVILISLKLLISPIMLTSMNFLLALKLFTFEQNQNKSNQDIEQIANSVGNFQKSEDNMMDSSKQSYIRKKDNSQIRMDSELKRFIKRKQSQINCCSLLNFYFGCNKNQKQQLRYAVNKITTKLDCCYIINKLNEIDKLKNIILTQDQLALFNYIPKPTIPFDMFEDNFHSKINELEKKKQYQFILGEEKQDIIKLEDAYKSYIKLKKKSILSNVDEIIIQHLDNEIKAVFDKISGVSFDQVLCQSLYQSQIIQSSSTSRKEQLEDQKDEVIDEPAIQLIISNTQRNK